MLTTLLSFVFTYCVLAARQHRQVSQTKRMIRVIITSVCMPTSCSFPTIYRT